MHKHRSIKTMGICRVTKNWTGCKFQQCICARGWRRECAACGVQRAACLGLSACTCTQLTFRSLSAKKHGGLISSTRRNSMSMYNLWFLLIEIIATHHHELALNLSKCQTSRLSKTFPLDWAWKHHGVHKHNEISVNGYFLSCSW